MALLEILSWVALGAFVGIFRASSSADLMQRTVPLAIIGGMVGGMIGHFIDWQITFGAYSASALLVAGLGSLTALTLHWMSDGSV